MPSSHYFCSLALSRTHLAVLVACCASLSWAQDQSQKVQVSKIEKAELPAGGTLRLERAAGEIWIEGWDQPKVEITTATFIKDDVPSSHGEEEKRLIENVRVTVARYGTELIVRTEYPHHFALPVVPYPGKGRKLDLEYHIRVPRTAAIAVDSHAAELHVDDVTGNVTASVGDGLIALRLPSDRLSIDAKSDFGGVDSDFGGHERRRFWLIGHEFRNRDAGASQNLHLRVGYGDIVILRIRKPPPPEARVNEQ